MLTFITDTGMDGIYYFGLKFLDLSDNQIVVGSSGFRSLRALRELNVRNTSLSVIGDNWFRAMRTNEMSTLNFSHNRITTVGRLPISQLRELDFSKNLLADIPSDVSRALMLTFLNLSGNQIKRITGQPFRPRLEQLLLGNNLLEHIDDNTFANLEHLKRLDLSQNRLHTIDSVKFEFMQKLEFLSLAYNYIVTLTDRQFQSLRNLQTLKLEGNKIDMIPNSFPSDLSNLMELYLNHNRLNFLPSDIVLLTKLKTVSIEGNP